MEVGGIQRELLVEGPSTRKAARVKTPIKGCVTPSRRVFVPGAACGFSKDKSRERSSSTKPKPKSKKQCTFFKAGTCKLGDKCHDLHGGGGQRSASPKRKPKGKPKGGKPVAAAVAISAPAESTASILKVHVPTPVPGSVALAASTDYGPSDNCRSWLLDTGCKFDLTTRASAPPYLQDSIMRATVPNHPFDRQ